MKLKQWQNVFHVIVNPNSIVQYVIQIKNGIIRHVSVNVKIILHAKKIIVEILTYISGNSKYLKSIADTSVTECDKIITFMDTVSTKKKYYTTNVSRTASINCHSMKVSDCFILHTVLLVILLLLILGLLAIIMQNKKVQYKNGK